jgi:formate dehydrogenase alpha subunit
MDLHIRDNLIYRVEGRFDNQVNFGQLCVKGRFGLDFVHAADRLTTPLMRANRSDEFGPVEWEQALDHVAGRLGAIRDEFGPDSVAVLVSAKCTNEENYLLQKFARVVIGTNNVDHCARL